MAKENKPTVLVLSGGPSMEREVSLESGREVAQALRAIDYSVVEGDITPDNLEALSQNEFDVVFPALHGYFGEDGQLQEILQSRKIKFTGSDSDSSRLAMDKYESKQIFSRNGLKTAKSVLFKTSFSAEQIEDSINNTIETVKFPCVIKPNNSGSSVGVFFAKEKVELLAKVRQALQDYGDCLVERYIQGREFTVGILGDLVLPVIEVKPANEFYDYEAKYQSDDTEYIFELDMDPAEQKLLQTDARCVFDALGCRDFGRVDFIVDSSHNHFILEVNTIPGLTTHSLLPKAAARIGINMPQLCEQIVQFALDRPI